MVAARSRWIDWYAAEENVAPAVVAGTAVE